MATFNFTGPVPEWLDPETEGWPMRIAGTVLAQAELHADIAVLTEEEKRRVEGLKGWKPEYGHSVVIPTRPRFPPEVREPWWEADDSPYRSRTTPYLVKLLLLGVVRAFGDVGHLGAKAEWIPPRVWWGLRPRPDGAPCFEAEGCAYWNVRVVDCVAFLAQIEVARDVAAVPVAGPRRDEQPKTEPASKGGRPRSEQFYVFARALLRSADVPDGLPEGEELFRHMRDWCDRRFADEVPGDSTIRAWIAKLDYRRPEHSTENRL